MFLQRHAPSTASEVEPPPPQPSSEAWASTPFRQVVPQAGKLGGVGSSSAPVKPAEMAATMTEVFMLRDVETRRVDGFI